MKVIYLSLLVLLVVARDYPLYNQCDARWANEKVGTSTKTICQGGDLISAVAMAMTGVGQTQNPSTLNTWLKSNKGYDSKNNFVWASINSFGLTYEGQVSNAILRLNLDVGYVVIINVNKGANWALATGYSGNTIYVKDSLHTSVTSYDLSQIVSGHNSVYKVPVSLPSSFLSSIEELFRISGRNRQEEGNLAL